MPTFDNDILKLKVNKSGKIVSRHKPLLLLLTISKLKNGHPNRFKFDDIEAELIYLLEKFGLNRTKKQKPHYPFVYLSGSPRLWECSVTRHSLRTPDAASRGEVIGALGKFPEEFLSYLQDKENANYIINLLLHEYWPEEYHLVLKHTLTTTTS